MRNVKIVYIIYKYIFLTVALQVSILLQLPRKLIRCWDNYSFSLPIMTNTTLSNYLKCTSDLSLNIVVQHGHPGCRRKKISSLRCLLFLTINIIWGLVVPPPLIVKKFVKKLANAINMIFYMCYQNSSQTT